MHYNIFARMIRNPRNRSVESTTLPRSVVYGLGATVPLDDPQGPNPETHGRRIIANSPGRRELRACFPQPVSHFDPGSHWCKQLYKQIREELGANDMDGPDGRTIYIVHPHKNPQIHPGHFNYIISDHVRKLKEMCPNINWTSSDEIVENRHLDRSSNQTSFHALAGWQEYTILGDAAQSPFAREQEPLFIVIDSSIDQGTTIANFISYLEHNGGKVVGVVASAKDLVQKDTRGHYRHVRLSDKFIDPARNTGRLKELADTFVESASRGRFLGLGAPKLSHEGAMRHFENTLNTIGHSALALTEGECERILTTLRKGKNDNNKPLCFPSFMSELKRIIQNTAADRAQSRESTIAIPFPTSALA
mgnify:CR=1 FL=1